MCIQRAIADQLAVYGYTLTNGRITTPAGRVTEVVIEPTRRGRLQAATADTGAILWTGGNAGHFLEKIWFAKRPAT